MKYASASVHSNQRGKKDLTVNPKWMSIHCLCSSLPHTQKKKNNSLKRGAICHFPTYSAASGANSIFLKSSTPRVPVFPRMINAREFIDFRARYFFWGEMASLSYPQNWATERKALIILNTTFAVGRVGGKPRRVPQYPVLPNQRAGWIIFHDFLRIIIPRTIFLLLSSYSPSQ